jgi:hypothetical protein
MLRRSSLVAVTTRRLRAFVGEMRNGIPRPSGFCLEESSHMPHLEEPERSLAAVDAFLERVQAR